MRRAPDGTPDGYSMETPSLHRPFIFLLIHSVAPEPMPLTHHHQPPPALLPSHLPATHQLAGGIDAGIIRESRIKSRDLPATRKLPLCHLSLVWLL